LEGKFFNLGGSTVQSARLSLDRSKALVQYLTSGQAPFVTLVECRKLDKGREAVIIEVDCEVPQYRAIELKKREKIAVVNHPKDRRMPEARALRLDFPRKCVMHLNLVPASEPASLCLFSEPWAELRLRLTAIGLIERIRWWIAKSATLELHRPDQALEPFVLGPGQPLIVSNRLIETLLTPGASFGQFGIVNGSTNGITLFELRRNRRASASTKPCLAVSVVSRPHPHCVVNNMPGDLLDLNSMLEAVGYESQDLVTTIWQATEGAFNSRTVHEMGFLLVLVLLQREGTGADQRTSPELVAFVAVPSGSEHGLLPFANSLGVASKGPMKTIHIKALKDLNLMKLNVHTELGPASAALLSGIDQLPTKIAGIGAGALGSQVVLNSVRSGIANWTVLDDDQLLPHNLVRHALSGDWLGHDKATAVTETANSLLDQSTVTGIVADVVQPGEAGDAVANALRCAEVIVDMSASVAVSRHLAFHAAGAKRCSMFLSPSGRDFVMLGEDGSRLIRLDLLEMQYYRAVASRPELSGHLESASEAVFYAGSCRDLTSRVPQELMGQHAAQGVRSLRQFIGANEAVASVHRVDPISGQCSRVEIQVHRPIEIGQLNGWHVWTDRGLMEELQMQRQESLPNETGGVLLGHLDQERQTFYVVHHIPAPPDSEKQPTVYIRGCEGLRNLYEEIQEKTLKNLTYVGEWHSHPVGCACAPSGVDVLAAEALSAKLEGEGVPGLMLIVCDGGTTCWMCCSRPSPAVAHERLEHNGQ